AHQANDVRAGSDKTQAGSLADLREMRVLAEKAVARVNRVGIRDFRGADDGWNVEIAACAFGRSDTDCFVGEAHRQTVPVRFGVNGYRADPQFLAGAYHPKGDLSTICDEDFLKRCGWQTGPLRTPPAGRWEPACFR